MLFSWKDSFNCNITEIDNQHKRLFELGSDLNQILGLRDGIDHYDELMRIFQALKEYTIYHFGYEEHLMAEHGYEGLEQQKKEHKAFIDKINDIINADSDDIDADQKRFTMDAFVFVADWISTHILKSDMGYKDFFNAKGVF